MSNTPIIVDSFQGMQSRLAVEDAYGAAIAANAAGNPWRRLSDLKLVPKSDYTTETFAGAGEELPSGSMLVDETTNVDVSGQPSFNGIVYPLASLFGFGDIATVGTVAAEHTFTYNGGAVVPASYTLHYGIPGRADEVPGFVFNTLNIGASRAGNDFGSGGFGKPLVPAIAAMGGVTLEVQTIAATGATSGGFRVQFRGRKSALINYNDTAAAVQSKLEATPTIGLGNVVVSGGALPAAVAVTFTGRLGGVDVPALTITDSTLVGGTATVTQTTPGADSAVLIGNVPIAPTMFDVYMYDSWANLASGSNKLLACYSAGFGIGDRYAQAKPVNSTKSSDSIYGAEGQEHTANLRLGADATSRALITNVKNGSKKFIRLHAVGGNIESGQAYEFRADLCVLVRGTDGYDSENGIHVATWNCQLAKDDISNNAASLFVRNRVRAL